VAKTPSAKNVLTPRKLTKLTDRQERFVRHFAVSNDRDEALKYAGFKVTTPESASATVSRLLSNVKVKGLLDDIRAKVAAEHGMDRDGVMNRLKVVYLAAFEAKDYSGAVSALRELGKIFGCYEVHQQQKRYSPEEVAAIKLRLEEAGMSFEEVHRPKALTVVNPSPLSNGEGAV
jgi:phage terminase small subunit